VRSHCATSSCCGPIGTDRRIRTDTGGGLSAVPLPLGYVSIGGPSGSRTRILLLAGELRIRLRYRPVVAGAGIEPARRAYETPLIARSPAVMVMG
jgi:hypothetical protein